MIMVLSRFQKVAIGSILIALTAGVYADETGFLPKLAPAKGEQCVEPNDVMRRNHFEFLLHTRDETMHQGIRGSKYSLAECINCHVLPDDNNQYVSHDSNEHFCSTCHEKAAVQIDCFECHSDKPVGDGHAIDANAQAPASHLLNESGVMSLSLLNNSLKNQQTNK